MLIINRKTLPLAKRKINPLWMTEEKLKIVKDKEASICFNQFLLLKSSPRKGMPRTSRGNCRTIALIPHETK